MLKIYLKYKGFFKILGGAWTASAANPFNN